VIGRKRRPSSTLILVLILLVLLPFLAYKQYEWLGKVSTSEREQMLENMRSAADRFRDDFDREITRIQSSFQLSGEASSTLQSQAASLYSVWEREAPYPKLVDNVFLITQPLETASEVERLEPSTLEFTTIDWPDQLSPLRRPHSFATFQLGRDLPLPDHFEQVFIVNGPVNPTIPAVVIQVMPELPMATGVIEFRSKAIAQLVVTLNREYLQKEFIPAVVRRDLAGTDGVLDYIVSVVETSDPRRVVYSSESDASVDAADVTIGILAARPADFRVAAGPLVGVAASRDIFQKRVNGKLTVQVLQSTTTGVRGVLKSVVDGPWQLALTHRAGSLDAAVAQTRQRNLAISFSILLILTLSVGLILVSAQRERRLARQQLEFVSAVSHELRTPLAVICSAGENLADGVVGSEEQTRQYGALVRNEGRRLAEMVEQVLDFAGIQSGRNAYKFEAAEVSDIVDQAIEIFGMQFRDAGITLDKHIDPNLPPILADRSAMIRALQNLIGNALKYGNQGNWLSVRAEAAGSDVLISVEDRGAGISPVDLPHIFEPFYRAAAVVDAQIQGSGLGLALVKQVVDAHHARINVDSTLQKGTTFTIILPTMDRVVSRVVSSHDQAYSPR
jgi:two-component system phosphate regulon sensor histidine kinase PhoR